jgi:molybdate transport system regulatory protein
MKSGKKIHHGRIISPPESGQYLDSLQLNQLEQSFREWATASSRQDVRLSRQRILILFLIIRQTGAKLNEVLSLDPFTDILPEQNCIHFHGTDTASKGYRNVLISSLLSTEIKTMLEDKAFRDTLQKHFDIDPGFVRRKFYERAQECGFPKEIGSPEALRKARAGELMQGNMPLPAVQMMLGHSTPNLTSAYVSFSEKDIQEALRLFLERESSRKTSARNAFFGKIQRIQHGDIQVCVKLTTMSGNTITTVITRDSMKNLALREGRLVTAEVKAPWVILEQADQKPMCSAENTLHGEIIRINKGAVNTEYAVRIADGTEICALASTESSRELGFDIGDCVWALFNCYAVVLHVD